MPPSAPLPHCRRAGPLFALAALAALIVPRDAEAGETRDPAAAEVHFRRGVELLKQESWAEACEAFATSMKLDPSVGTQINVARCAAHDGRLALAWAEFKKAQALNAETPLEKRKRDVDGYIAGELAKLEPRLPWVSLAISPKDVKELTLSRDGASIPAVGYEVAVPIDPGEHKFSAAAPGFARADKTVTLREGERLTVTLELRPDAGAPALPPPVDPPPAAPARPPAPPPPGEPGPGSPLVPVGATFLALGGASLIVSAISGGLAFSDRQTLDGLVDAGRCSEAGGTIACEPSAREEAHAAIARGEPLAVASTVTLFAGLGVAAAGAAMLGVGVVAESGATKPAVAVAPWFAPGGAGLAAGGRF